MCSISNISVILIALKFLTFVTISFSFDTLPKTELNPLLNEYIGDYGSLYPEKRFDGSLQKQKERETFNEESVYPKGAINERNENKIQADTAANSQVEEQLNASGYNSSNSEHLPHLKDYPTDVQDQVTTPSVSTNSTNIDSQIVNELKNFNHSIENNVPENDTVTDGKTVITDEDSHMRCISPDCNLSSLFFTANIPPDGQVRFVDGSEKEVSKATENSTSTSSLINVLDSKELQHNKVKRSIPDENLSTINDNHSDKLIDSIVRADSSTDIDAELANQSFETLTEYEEDTFKSLNSDELPPLPDKEKENTEQLINRNLEINMNDKDSLFPDTIVAPNKNNPSKIEKRDISSPESDYSNESASESILTYLNLTELVDILRSDRNVQAYILNQIILYVPVCICNILLWIVIVKLLRHIRRHITSKKSSSVGNQTPSVPDTSEIVRPEIPRKSIKIGTNDDGNDPQKNSDEKSAEYQEKSAGYQEKSAEHQDKSAEHQEKSAEHQEKSAEHQEKVWTEPNQ